MRNTEEKKKNALTGDADHPSADIVNLSYSASGVARHGGKVVFIPYTVPGDIVRFEQVEDKKTFSNGRLVEILKSSDERRAAPCPYFGVCGGCQWQHIKYPFQLRSKKEITADLVRRIGDIQKPDVHETYSAGEEWHYRQRVRFQVGHRQNALDLGFAIYGSNKVVDIEKCLIVQKQISGILAEIRKFKHELKGLYDFEVYYSESDGCYVFYGVCRDSSCFGDMKKLPGLFKGGALFDKKSGRSIVFGDPSLTYHVNTAIGGYTLKIYAGGFVQANQAVNELILNVLAEKLRERGGERAIELYAGSGNFTLLFSRLFNHVTAVEMDPLSGRALGENIFRNKAGNVTAAGGDVYTETVRLFNLKRKFDFIFLDPPRTGAKEIMPFLSKFGASQIAYLSCNPSTLARDLKTLVFNGYELDQIIPFDMFPQTFHIEALALLTRKK